MIISPDTRRLERIEDKLDALREDVAVLKERDRRRSAVWGGLSGLAISLLGVILQAIF